jgi:probable blue pigment (indigoidine) exporter
VLSVPWLGVRIRRLHLVAGALGVAGVALLVLRSSARLDLWGLMAMLGVVVMMAVATVLTKRWGHPPGMSATGFTGWTFLLGGLTLLPFTLAFEGLPKHLSGRELGGLAYLVVVSGILAYAVWFWGLQRLPASSVTFLSLLNPVVAALLGWVVLDQRLNFWQLLGALLVVVSVLLGQDVGRRSHLRARR